MATIYQYGAFICAIVISAAPVTQSLAAGTHSDTDKHGQVPTNIGSPGHSDNADRTIQIIMTDNAFDPGAIAARTGETIRFVIFNEGEFVHEFNIGTAAMHSEHQEEMFEMFKSGVLDFDRIDRAAMAQNAMAHAEPNSVLLEPGETAEITWKFDTQVSLQFACNIPGHYESGMVGEFGIKNGAKSMQQQFPRNSRS